LPGQAFGAVRKFVADGVSKIGVTHIAEMESYRFDGF
jgi:hypothetical protein